jgi:DNA polymerase-4
VVLDHTFATDTHTPTDLHAALRPLVEAAGRQLRQQGRVARRIGIMVEHSDGRPCARQLRVEPPSANDLTLWPPARHVLTLATARRTRIRHMRLICDRLVYPPAQLPLFETERRTVLRQERLVNALDRIRERFGTQAVGFAMEKMASAPSIKL